MTTLKVIKGRDDQGPKNGKPGTGNREPSEHGTQNPKPHAPAGPLAQAVRGGADVGVIKKPPPIPKQAKAEPEEEPIQKEKQVDDTKFTALQTAVINLLESATPQARVKGLKLAMHCIGPELAVPVAKAAVPVHEKTRDGSIEPSKRWEGEVEKIKPHAKEVLQAIFTHDPAKTVEKLLNIYPASIRMTVNGEECSDDNHKDVVDHLWRSGTNKNTELLELANAHLGTGDWNAADYALDIIKALGIPEGIPLLKKIAEWDRFNQDKFLDACGTIGTPECIETLNLAAERIKPDKHERMAEIIAKICDIDLG